MSVLACNRSECEAVMCDRYSHEYGYICDECFKELIAIGSITHIYTFMDTPKGVPFVSEDVWAEFINNKFPRSRYEIQSQ